MPIAHRQDRLRRTFANEQAFAGALRQNGAASAFVVEPEPALRGPTLRSLRRGGDQRAVHGAAITREFGETPASIEMPRSRPRLWR